MHNEAKYPHPNEFDGLRFLKDWALPVPADGVALWS